MRLHGSLVQPTDMKLTVERSGSCTSTCSYSQRANLSGGFPSENPGPLLTITFLSSFEDNLDLHRHILAAANLKQPWFFESLLQKYIQMARQLSSSELQLPVTITIFQELEGDLRNLHSSATFPQITLKSPASVLRVLKFSVMILEHFVSDLVIMDDQPLITEIVNLMLGIYTGSCFAVKLEALKFFYRFFKCQDQLRQSSVQLFIQVLIITTALLKSITNNNCHRPSNEELESFDKTLMKLFEVMKVQPVVEGTRLPPTQLLSASLEFLKSQKSKGDPVTFTHFPKSFPAVVRNLSETSCDFSLSRSVDEVTLLEYLKCSSSPELWICGLYLKYSHKDYVALKETLIWKEILRRTSPEFDPERMHEMLDLLLSFKGVTTGVFPREDYEAIVSRVFQRQNEEMQQNSEASLARNLQLIQKMLLIPDAASLNDRTQQQLFDVLVYGLEDLLELKFRPAAGVYQDFYECQKRHRDKDTEVLIINLVATLNKEHLCRATQNKLRLLMESIMRKSSSSNVPTATTEAFLVSALPELLKNGHLPFEEKVAQFLEMTMTKSQYHDVLIRILNPLICLSAGHVPGSCSVCSGDTPVEVNRPGEAIIVALVKRLLQLDQVNAHFEVLDACERISKHFPEKFLQLTELVLETLLKPNAELLMEVAVKVPVLIPVLKQRSALLEGAIMKIVKITKESLNSSKNRPLQLAALQVIRELGLATQFEMPTFLRIFKLTLFFLMREESRVVSEAMLVCEEICLKRKFKPRNMFNWYKQSILELLIPLVASIYLLKGVGISSSLIHVAKLFEFFGPNSFIYENHSLLLAHLLPFVVQYSQCEQILKDVCDVLQTDLSTTLVNSFPVIYQCLFLNEPDEIHQKCGQLITETTGQSVYELLHLSDVRLTI